MMLHHNVDDVGQLAAVRFRDGGHYGTVHARLTNGIDAPQRCVERTGLAEEVMRLAHAVYA